MKSTLMCPANSSPETDYGFMGMVCPFLASWNVSYIYEYAAETWASLTSSASNVSLLFHDFAVDNILNSSYQKVQQGAYAMREFCDGMPLWDDIVWEKSAFPDVAPCFKNIFLSWLPSIIVLLLLAPLELSHLILRLPMTLRFQKKKNLTSNRGALCKFQMAFLCIFVFSRLFLPVVANILVVFSSNDTQAGLHTIPQTTISDLWSRILESVVAMFAIEVCVQGRLSRQPQRGILLFFWLIVTFTHALRLYSSALAFKLNENVIEILALYTSYISALALSFMTLLTGMPENMTFCLNELLIWIKRKKTAKMNSGDVDNVIQKLAKATVADSSEEIQVSFAGRGLKLNTSDDAKEIVDKIKECKNMKILQMEGNTLGVDAAKAIAKALESQPNFQKAFWKDMFTGRLKEEIPRALGFLSSGITLANARLTVLDLSDNALGPIGVRGILPLLRSPSCFSLQCLYLNNNGLGTEGGKLLAQSLHECHKASHAAGCPLALKVFVCGRNRLENAGATAMASLFKVLGSLEEVEMPQNGIQHEGISALAEGLSANHSLKVLNLNDNIFTCEGAKAFAKALEVLQNLECLNFGDCLVRTDGSKAIAEALSRGHSNLKVVNLSFNEIKCAGGVAIVKAMQDKAKLEVLNLDGNRFGPDGCDELQDLVATFIKPEVLSIDDDEEEGSDDDDQEVVCVDDDDKDEEEEVNKVPVQTLSHGDIPLQTKVTAADFFASPSIDRLIRLGNNRVSLILEELGVEVKNESYLAAFIKISSVIQPDNKEHKQIANECADALLSALFKQAKENDKMHLLTNDLLVHLGLIKSEDKSLKAPADLKGPLTVLHHVVQQSYFDVTTKNILQLFISRPNKAVENTGKISHALKTVLFQ